MLLSSDVQLDWAYSYNHIIKLVHVDPIFQQPLKFELDIATGKQISAIKMNTVPVYLMAQISLEHHVPNCGHRGILGPGSDGPVVSNLDIQPHNNS